MKKILLCLVIVLMLCMLVACNTKDELEEEIIRQAKIEMNIEGDASLTYLFKEDPDWLEYTVYYYILECNGKHYWVEVQRQFDQIHMVDVITEI